MKEVIEMSLGELSSSYSRQVRMHSQLEGEKRGALRSALLTQGAKGIVTPPVPAVSPIPLSVTYKRECLTLKGKQHGEGAPQGVPRILQARCKSIPLLFGGGGVLVCVPPKSNCLVFLQACAPHCVTCLPLVFLTDLPPPSVYQADASLAKKGFNKRLQIWGVLIFILLLSLTLTILGVSYFWKPAPKKIYELEHIFLSNMEKQKILLKIDPLTWTETFQTGKGSEEILEIHDFKNGITVLFFMGDPKCFIQNQIKGIPETSHMEMEEPEAEETAATYFEQSVLWVPGEKPVENKDFLKDSKMFDLCKNVTAYWIHPTLLRDPDILDFEKGSEDLVPRDEQNQADGQQESRSSSKEESQGPKRHARQLTEEDLPVNDYTENGLEFHPLWDERGYCCARCRRAHRYCRRICEPLLGYYPYPYCYQGGRVICRIIMPCNWWIARMLGRV
ncbi:tenomodulin [Python bivittatus]|uniref:Tenomodulin n=1 Tax=Python bivittatus TaxID=176946 RepID=A0A9F5MY99_PYTBI|nr:tenomodulin [Python bivittatus]